MDPTNNIIPEELEFEDTLSLCDLPLHSHGSRPGSPCSGYPNSPSQSHPQDLFEFPFDPKFASFNKSDIIFCGKVMEDHEQSTDDELFADQSRYLFPLSSARLFNLDNKEKKPSSAYDPIFVVNSVSKPSRTGSCRSVSRKHKALIGLAMIPPKVELSDIKKRQSRRNPAPLFPAVAGGEVAVVDGDRSGGRGHHWSLLRPLRCRGHLASALAKASLGCIPHV